MGSKGRLTASFRRGSTASHRVRPLVISDTSATRWKAHLHPSIPAIVLLPRFVAKKPPISPPAIMSSCAFTKKHLHPTGSRRSYKSVLSNAALSLHFLAQVMTRICAGPLLDIAH